MLLCLNCNRRKRVRTVREKKKGKSYWVSYCITCGKPVTMEDYETGTEKNK